MNEWQQKFLGKVDVLRGASRDQFEHSSERIVVKIFEEFREFTSQQSLTASIPIVKPGIRTFKFSLTENTYLMVTFRLAGFDHCEAQSEFFVPGRQKLTSTPAHVEIPNLDEAWVRTIFEQSLDRFIDTYVQSLSQQEGGQPDPSNQANEQPKAVPVGPS